MEERILGEIEEGMDVSIECPLPLGPNLGQLSAQDV